jgi:hypothetical protein
LRETKEEEEKKKKNMNDTSLRADIALQALIKIKSLSSDLSNK